MKENEQQVEIRTLPFQMDGSATQPKLVTVPYGDFNSFEPGSYSQSQLKLKRIARQNSDAHGLHDILQPAPIPQLEFSKYWRNTGSPAKSNTKNHPPDDNEAMWFPQSPCEEVLPHMGKGNRIYFISLSDFQYKASILSSTKCPNVLASPRTGTVSSPN